MDPKKSHMENYLNQCARLASEQQQNAMVLYNRPVDDNISMEDFKTYVKKWFEIDNYMKKLQEVMKEKRVEKNKLSEVIMRFMCKYNIEDLNTKEGRIRCKNVVVKAPLNKQQVQQRLSDYFSNDEDKKTELFQKIYEEREKVEKTTLRRLKIS